MDGYVCIHFDIRCTIASFFSLSLLSTRHIVWLKGEEVLLTVLCSLTYSVIYSSLYIILITAQRQHDVRYDKTF